MATTTREKIVAVLKEKAKSRGFWGAVAGALGAFLAKKASGAETLKAILDALRK